MGPLPMDWGISRADLEELANLVGPAGVFAFVWFAIMAATGIIASRQGRDDGLWAVIALFIGPIAPLVLLLAPRESLRRTSPDATRVDRATAPEWQPHADGWIPLSSPPPPITIEQRLMAAVVGGALGAAGAAVLLAVGAQAVQPLLLLTWSLAGAVAGYLVSGALVGAEGTRRIVVGIAAGAVAIAVAELFLGVIGVVEASSNIVEMLAALPAIVFALVAPVVYALFAPASLATALIAGVLWAMVVGRMLIRAAPSVGPAVAAQ